MEGGPTHQFDSHILVCIEVLSCGDREAIRTAGPRPPCPPHLPIHTASATEGPAGAWAAPNPSGDGGPDFPTPAPQSHFCTGAPTHAPSLCQATAQGAASQAAGRAPPHLQAFPLHSGTGQVCSHLQDCTRSWGHSRCLGPVRYVGVTCLSGSQTLGVGPALHGLRDLPGPQAHSPMFIPHTPPWPTSPLPVQQAVTTGSSSLASPPQ